jgi:hypothetical protein
MEPAPLEPIEPQPFLGVEAESLDLDEGLFGDAVKDVEDDEDDLVFHGG